MSEVAEWKHQERVRMKKKYKSPVGLTVGDQWSDIVRTASGDDFDKLDKAYPASWSVVRPNDNVSVWGLKLKAKK